MNFRVDKAIIISDNICADRVAPEKQDFSTCLPYKSKREIHDERCYMPARIEVASGTKVGAVAKGKLAS